MRIPACPDCSLRLHFQRLALARQPIPKRIGLRPGPMDHEQAAFEAAGERPPE
jgi:hypothetical protein